MYTKDTRVDLNNKDRDLHDDLRKVKHKFSETRDAIGQTARDAKMRAQDFLQTSLQDLNDKRSDIQDNVVSYVKSNPVKSVGVAIVLGLIISKLLRK